MGQILYYASYYVIPYAIDFVKSYPAIAVAAVLLFVFRRRLPSPYLYLRTARHMHRLQVEVTQNPDNATARRDLALVWLRRRRPKKAAQLLTEARRRDREAPELAYLLAVANVESGNPEPAVDLCIEAASKEPKLRYGDVYRVAAIALTDLGRFAEAEDALLRLLKINASSVEGWTRLARLRRKLGDAAGAKAALEGAVEAFQQSPRFRRRAELGWYLKARWVGLIS